MMASGAGDVAIAAQGLVREQQPAKFDLRLIEAAGLIEVLALDRLDA